MYGGGPESCSFGSKTNLDPGSGCGGCGNGTSRIVPIGVVLVTLCFRFMIFPASSTSSGSVTMLMEAYTT